jgi:hypothetical protein
MEYNPNPTVYRPTHRRSLGKPGSFWLVDADSEEDDHHDQTHGEDVPEPLDSDEIFGMSLHASPSSLYWVKLTNAISADLIRSIADPEHLTMSLEDLLVVSSPQVKISEPTRTVDVEFTPTVPHCGASTLIGIYLSFVNTGV